MTVYQPTEAFRYFLYEVVSSRNLIRSSQMAINQLIGWISERWIGGPAFWVKPTLQIVTWIHCPMLTPHHFVRWLGPACWQVRFVTRSSLLVRSLSQLPFRTTLGIHDSYQLGFPDPWWAVTLRKEERTFPDSWTSRIPSIAFPDAKRLGVSLKCNLPFLSMLSDHNLCIIRFWTREWT